MVSNNAWSRWRLMFAGIAFKGDLGKRSRGNYLLKNNTCRHPESLVARFARGSKAAASIRSLAQVRVKELFASYQKPVLPTEAERELRGIVEREAKKAGMDKLPALS